MSFFLPQNPTERRFFIGFGLVALISVALLIWLGADGWAAFSEKWMPILGGDLEVRAKAIDFARGGTVFSAGCALILLTVLWFTRRWWCAEFSEKPSPRPAGRIFWIGLGAILLIATVVRAPRMTLSLYNDEIETLQRYVAGTYFDKFVEKADERLLSDEIPKFRAVSWTKTAFENRRGNNHSLYSILARSLHGQSGVHEVPLRIPALLGGLLSVAALGWIFAALGRPRVGLIAMLVLALHPWHVRFSTEARGYGLQMGFAAMAVFFLIRAWRGGGWGWWIGFAVAQACCLWANVGALYFAIGLNGAVALALAVRFFRERERSQILPWLVANGLSAMVFLFAAAPLIPQLKAATQTNDTLKSGLLFGWWPDLTSLLVIGMPWYDGDPGNPFNPALEKWWGSEGLVLSLAVLLVVGVTLTGLISLIRSNAESRWLLVVAPITGILAATAVCVITQSTLMEWYLVWGTIFVAGWFASGVAAICFDRNARASGWRRWAVYGCIFIFLAAVWKPLRLYRSHSKQALRNATEIVNAEKPKPVIAFWHTEAAIYDPQMRVVFKPEQLAAIEEKAKNEGRDFFFILGHKAAAAAEQPSIIEKLDGPEFEKVAELPGLEESQFRTSVYRQLR